MKKLVTTLFALLLGSSLIGCNSNVASPNTSTSTFTYKAAEEEMINVTKEGVEIASIEMEKLPSKGIKIASWDSYNIQMKVMYSDLSTQSFSFKEKHIPLEYRHFLGEVGHHTLSLAINGVDLHFGFDIIPNPDFKGYKCKFYNTRGQSEALVEEVTVGYYQNAVYSGPAFEDVDINIDTVERFIGWDYSLNAIHQDMEFRNVFRNVEKRFCGRSVTDNYHVISTSVNEDSSQSALIYLGRVQSVTINHNSPIYHEKGNAEETFAFGTFNPYNEMWNEMNESIHKYAFEYNVVPKYNTVFYGNSGAFSNSTTFLANFESKYGEIASTSLSLEDGDNINTSILPNYSTTYEMASNFVSETRNLDSNSESGYYRLAVTMSYDVYVSVSLSKVAEGRYQLLPLSKFNFAPVSETQKVLIQFSETEEFDNPLGDKLSLSNEDLFNVANGLTW